VRRVLGWRREIAFDKFEAHRRINQHPEAGQYQDQDKGRREVCYDYEITYIGIVAIRTQFNSTSFLFP
jgi:hypothetical protein